MSAEKRLLLHRRQMVHRIKSVDRLQTAVVCSAYVIEPLICTPGIILHIQYCCLRAPYFAKFNDRQNFPVYGTTVWSILISPTLSMQGLCVLTFPILEMVKLFRQMVVMFLVPWQPTPAMQATDCWGMRTGRVAVLECGLGRPPLARVRHYIDILCKHTCICVAIANSCPP